MDEQPQGDKTDRQLIAELTEEVKKLRKEIRQVISNARVYTIDELPRSTRKFFHFKWHRNNK